MAEGVERESLCGVDVDAPPAGSKAESRSKMDFMHRPYFKSNQKWEIWSQMSVRSLHVIKIGCVLTGL